MLLNFMRNQEILTIEEQTTEDVETEKVLFEEEGQREKVETDSEFLEKIRIINGYIEYLEKEIASFKEREPSKEAVDLLFLKLDEIIDRAKKVEQFFCSKDSGGKICKEYFYTDINWNAHSFETKINIEASRQQLELLKTKLEKWAIPSLKNREEGDKEDETYLDEREAELKTLKNEAAEKITVIEKNLSGTFGRFRKGKYEQGILEKLPLIRDYLEGAIIQIPDIEDYDLKNLLIKVNEAREYCARGKAKIEQNQEIQEKQLREIYKEINEYLDGVISQFGEVKKNTEMLASTKEIEIEWQSFFENKVVPAFNLSAEDKEKYKTEIEEAGREVSKLDLKSFDNIRESLQYFFCYYCQKRKIAPAEALERIKEEVEKVERTKFIAVGRKEKGLRGLLEEGKLRCIWDFSEEERRKKARNIMDDVGYVYKREQAEKSLGIWGENPISSILGSENSRDEFGAPRQYGEYLVVLKDEAYDRSIFTESDSMNPYWMIEPLRPKGSEERHDVVNRRLISKHASIAKALFNDFRFNPSTKSYYFPSTQENNLEYIEALVCGGVKLEDVKEIVVRDIDKVPEDIKKILEEKSIPLRTKVSFEKAGEV